MNKDWLIRDEIEQEKHNIMHKPLVKRDRIFLSPLHIKLGLFKQSGKALDKESSAFAYLAEKVPSLSTAKIIGIFIGPQMKKITLHTRGLEEQKLFKLTGVCF